MKRLLLLLLTSSPLLSLETRVMAGTRFNDQFEAEKFGQFEVSEYNYEAGVMRIEKETLVYGEGRFQFYPWQLRIGALSEALAQGYFISNGAYDFAYDSFADKRPLGATLGLDTGLAGYRFSAYTDRFARAQVQTHSAFLKFSYLKAGGGYASWGQAREKQQAFAFAKAESKILNLSVTASQNNDFAAWCFFNKGDYLVRAGGFQRRQATPLSSLIYHDLGTGAALKIRSSFARLSATGNRKKQRLRALLFYRRLALYTYWRRSAKQALMPGITWLPGEKLSANGGLYYLHPGGYMVSLGAGFGKTFRLVYTMGRIHDRVFYPLDNTFLPFELYQQGFSEDQQKFLAHHFYGAQLIINYRGFKFYGRLVSQQQSLDYGVRVAYRLKL